MCWLADHNKNLVEGNSFYSQNSGRLQIKAKTKATGAFITVNVWPYSLYRIQDLSIWSKCLRSDRIFLHLCMLVSPLYCFESTSLGIINRSESHDEALCIYYLLFFSLLIDNTLVIECIYYNSRQPVTAECWHFSNKLLFSNNLFFLLYQNPTKLWPQNQGTYWTWNYAYRSIPNTNYVGMHDVDFFSQYDNQ